MHLKLLTCAALCLAALIGPARAADPFPLNEDRIKVVNEKNFRSETYVIPTLYLHIAARIQTDAKNEGASTKARVFVEGMTKSMVQDLAKGIYDDLVARIRAEGHKVLAYEDLKSELGAMARMTPNPKFGMPTKLFDKGPGIDFMIVTPSDEQAFDYDFARGPTWPWRDLVKARNAVLIVPQIHFTLPQVWAEKGGSLFSSSITLKSDPALKLYGATVHCMPADLGWCSIQVQEHGKRLAAENVGAMQKLAEDRYEGAKTGGMADWVRTVADFAFVIDPPAFSTGVQRVGLAINERTLKSIKASR